MSGSGFDLVPLDCPTCGAALAAAGEDVVFYCTACRNGYHYQSAEPHLVPLEVQFVAASNLAAERYLPFWLLEAEVEVQAKGGRLRGLIQNFFPGAEGGRSGRGTFVVPAFEADLDATVRLAEAYTAGFPGLDERLGEKLTGGCFGVEDARKLAHFAVIAAEVDKGGVLRDLDYAIAFGESRLLGVPFSRHGEGWRDSIHGIPVSV